MYVFGLDDNILDDNILGAPNLKSLPLNSLVKFLGGIRQH